MPSPELRVEIDLRSGLAPYEQIRRQVVAHVADGPGPQRGRADRGPLARPGPLPDGVRAEVGQADERGGEPHEHALPETPDGGRGGLGDDRTDEDCGRHRGDADRRRVPACGAAHGVLPGEPVERGLARRRPGDQHDCDAEPHEHGQHGHRGTAPQQVVARREEEVDALRLLGRRLYQHLSTFPRRVRPVKAPSGTGPPSPRMRGLSCASHRRPTRVRCAGPMTLAPPAPDQRAWLDLLTAPEAGELLAVALGADGASLGTWRVHQVHARPGAEVTVGYDVVAHRALAARPDAGPATVDAAEYLLATTAPLSPHVVGPGVVRLADGPRVVHVWRHPADPLLPGLAAACDADELTRRLAAAGALAPGPAGPP